MSEFEVSDVTEFTRGKTDRLVAGDLMAGNLVGRIERVTGFKQGDEMKLNIYLSSWPLPWKPCLTMTRTMTVMWGKDPRGWVGKHVELWRDPDAEFGTEKVGGVRLWAAQIDKELNIQLQGSQRKRVKVRVRVLELPDPKPAQTFEDRRAALVAAVIGAGLLDDADAKFGPADEWDAVVCKNVAAWLREVRS